MNYYYDVKLNFLDRYYNFYEWMKFDKVIDVKSIPIYNVSFNVFEKLVQYKIKVSSKFLDEIENKTLVNGGRLKYAAIFTNYSNSIAVIFNENGESILCSSLLFDDEALINEICYKYKNSNLDFNVIKKYDKEKESRQAIYIRKFLKNELNSIGYDEFKLKFIYSVLFSDAESDLDCMKEKIIKKISNEVSEDVYNLYKLLKLSHKNV